MKFTELKFFKSYENKKKIIFEILKIFQEFSLIDDEV